MAQVYFDGLAYRWADTNVICPLDVCFSTGIDRLPGFTAEGQLAARAVVIQNFLDRCCHWRGRGEEVS